MTRLPLAVLVLAILAGTIVSAGCSGGVHLDKQQVTQHQKRKDQLDGGSPRKATVDQGN